MNVPSTLHCMSFFSFVFCCPLFLFCLIDGIHSCTFDLDAQSIQIEPHLSAWSSLLKSGIVYLLPPNFPHPLCHPSHQHSKYWPCETFFHHPSLDISTSPHGSQCSTTDSSLSTEDVDMEQKCSLKYMQLQQRNIMREARIHQENQRNT